MVNIEFTSSDYWTGDVPPDQYAFSVSLYTADGQKIPSSQTIVIYDIVDPCLSYEIGDGWESTGDALFYTVSQLKLEIPTPTVTITPEICAGDPITGIGPFEINLEISADNELVEAAISEDDDDGLLYIEDNSEELLNGADSLDSVLTWTYTVFDSDGNEE